VPERGHHTLARPRRGPGGIEYRGDAAHAAL
jgi:hypothetical protein